jgi:hypothetical protein
MPVCSLTSSVSNHQQYLCGQHNLRNQQRKHRRQSTIAARAHCCAWRHCLAITPQQLLLLLLLLLLLSLLLPACVPT